MNFQHFKVLMWKNVHLKIHHFILTALEFLLTIGLTWLTVNLVESLFGSKLSQNYEEPSIPPRPLSNLVSFSYAPTTPAIEKFMKELKDPDITLGEKFTDGDKLEAHLFESSRVNLIGVLFENFNDPLPDKFTYVLRQSVPINNIDNSYLAKAQLKMNQHFILSKFKQSNIKLNASVLQALNAAFQPTVQQFPYVKNTWKVGVMATFCIIFFSILILIQPVTRLIVEEKITGMKELMKIAGVTEWMMWLCWFIYVFTFIFIAITITIFFVISSMFVYVPRTIVWLFLVLFCAAHITFSFMLSTLCQTKTTATVVYCFCALVCVLEFYFRKNYERYVPFLKYLLPISNFLTGSEMITGLESGAFKFTWARFIFSDNSLFLIILMLFLNIFIYMLLAHYIINIYPGKFGVRKSPLFFFEAIFSRSEDFEAPAETLEQDRNFFEAPPSNAKALLHIVDLQKHFKSVHAVRGVNLDIYEGETTVLLGHNGAGKTVTMSMLTGLISPSSGSVYYDGRNIFDDMDEFRLHIGFCPQENRSFPYLSVMNHLLLFGMLKGLSMHEASEEASEYLHVMGMTTKVDSRANDLSGGMKRKLNLSMAMMGNVEILILDEPTAGMDAESRRSLWDLLLSFRGKRSIILTTHYMMEADILGNRIAIMNHGIVVCYGTGMFLKKTFNSGYELTITKSSDNSRNITDVVSSAIPTSSVVSGTKREIVYKLPLSEVPRFPALFRALESATERLGIESIGVTATTLEQVFLKTGGVVAYDPKSYKSIPTSDKYNKVVGPALIIQQIGALLKKKFLFTIRDKLNFFLRQILLFLILLYVVYMLLGPQNPNMLPRDSTPLSLSRYYDGRVLYQEMNPSISLQNSIKSFVSEKRGVFMQGDGSHMGREIFSYGIHNYMKFSNELVSGIEVNRTTTGIHYSLLPFSLPIAIDLYTNALLRTLANTDKYSIETTAHPVSYNEKNKTTGGKKVSCIDAVIVGSTAMTWFMAMSLFTADILIFLSEFASMELQNGFYHMQMMSRLSPAVYWFATILFDFVIFVIIMAVRITLIRLVNQDALFIGFLEEFYIYLLMLTLYGIAGSLMSYTLISLNFSNKALMNVNFLGSILIMAYKAASIFLANENIGLFVKIIMHILWILTLIFPICTFHLFFMNWLADFYINNECLFCVEHYKPVCEAFAVRQSYWQFGPETSGLQLFEGLLMQFLILIFQIPVYSIILLLIHSGMPSKMMNSVVKKITGTKYKSTGKRDEDVQRELEQVQLAKSTVARLKDDQEISLLVDRLRKSYLTPKVVNPVSDVSFMVERGTCFGFLGTNGAGKTTTFKMLTAEIIPTMGDAYINGIRLSQNRQQYLFAAGYCPQTNSIIEQLTGMEILSIIASMKGISSEDVKDLVNKWMSVVGLEEYKDRKSGTYSGGNKRKLCCTMALLGDPKVVFLDEPTTGVDPVARRSMYDIMGQSRASGQTVILTSHDIDECETVCDRLTIMVLGEMKCIGTVEHLKKRFGRGFSAAIKIDDSPESEEKINRLKQAVHDLFAISGITLRDQRADILYYLIRDTSLKWSILFEKMEYIKSSYPDIVYDYVLTDVPLEEVFISFAKIQRGR